MNFKEIKYQIIDIILIYESFYEFQRLIRILIKNNLIIQVVKIEKYIRKYGLFI